MVSRTRRNVLGGAAALGALAAGNRASGFWVPAPPMGTWTQRADMPFAVQDISATAIWRHDATDTKPPRDGTLVSAGGMVPETLNLYRVTKQTVYYDPRTEWWGKGPDLPWPRHHLALCSHGRSVYAMGGYYSNSENWRRQWQMCKDVWRLDTLNQREWYGLPALPDYAAEGAVASVGDTLHFMGGRAPRGSSNFASEDHTESDRHWAYDGTSWTDRAPLLSPRYGMAAAPFGESVYLIGGRRVSGGNLSLNEVYAPSMNRWQRERPLPKSTRPDSPAGRTGHAAAVWKNKIYVFGGEWWIDDENNGVYSDVHEYDPKQDTWRSVAVMPRPRHGLGAVALDDGIYLVGGAAGAHDFGVTAFVDRFVI